MRYFVLATVALTSLSGCLMYEDRHFHPGVQPVTKQDVISMSQAGQPEANILEAINQNGVAAKPNADDLVDMQSAGVTSRVMAGMVEAPVREPQPGVESRTRYYYDPTPEIVYGFGVLTGYLIWRHCR